MHAASPPIGRFFTEEENRLRARVAVIGATVVRQIFGNQDPIGEFIKIDKISFQVMDKKEAQLAFAATIWWLCLS